MIKNPSLKNVVNEKCKTCNFYLRNISKIGAFITEDATKSLINAYVTSRLDYCNSLLFGLTKYQLKRLQKIQNSAVHLIFKLSFKDHVTLFRKNLHWLPLPQRIVYKLAIIIFKCVHGAAPSYLSDGLNLQPFIRSLRSSDTFLMSFNNFNSAYGRRSFINNAPTVWNAVPVFLRTQTDFNKFCTDLKTFLFMKAYV